MPYIPREKREGIVIDSISSLDVLNYAITSTIDEYIHNVGLCYSAINDVIGVLECAKLELYRRVAARYEDGKCLQNGDVYRSHE